MSVDHIRMTYSDERSGGRATARTYWDAMLARILR